MAPAEGRAVEVTVVDPDGDRREEIVDALDGDTRYETASLDDVDAAVERVRDGGTNCVVLCDAADYGAVRDGNPTVPVVVVGPDVDRDSLDAVLADPYADHVALDGLLATALPARVDSLVGGDQTSWQLADFAEQAVVEFDLDSFALLTGNEKFFDAWGWDRDRLRDATLVDLRETDITHEFRGVGRGEEGEEELEWIRDEDPVGSLVDRALGGLYEVREWHCRTADGDAFKSEVRVVADDAAGRGYLVATVPDPRRSDDGQAYDERSMLHSVMEHVPMSVYFKDEQSRHVLVSEDVAEPFIESPAGKILHTPEDVHGKTDFDLYPADGAAESVEEDREVMETGRPLVDKVEQFQPPQGRPLYFQTTKAPWYADDGRVRGIVGVTVDITDQKRRENELDRQNERLEEFASIVSHDLRNPLNVAQGRLELYRQTGEASELDAVEEMHDRMESLISDVLTFAREGSRVEDAEWVDGASHAEQAWTGVDTAEATLAQDWEYRIEAEPGRLVRLFENLFRNAVEHGGPTVAVEVGTLAAGSGFFVADDGPGVPEDRRESVFDRGETTDEHGTGFGLAIVREIADAHGWRVGVTESETGGARFEFSGVPRGSAPEDGD